MAEMEEKPVSAVLVGTGEYTTGYVHSAGSKSDKKIGVVGLCMFELRRLGRVDKISLAGTTGSKYQGIRKHLKDNIQDVYNGLDVTVDTFPEDDVARDVCACKSSSRGIAFAVGSTMSAQSTVIFVSRPKSCSCIICSSVHIYDWFSDTF
eukprot:m.60424 g.60424  ORF g.60424 m.60424 type:complete len:150 (-) comp11819_c0_seq1:3568-4017(-)